VGIDASLMNALSLAGWNVTPDTFGYALWRLKISQIAPILPFVFLVLMLVFRPKGLLGTREG
jgi:branched-chain amino acid transport system permease protein